MIKRSGLPLSTNRSWNNNMFASWLFLLLFSCCCFCAIATSHATDENNNNRSVLSMRKAFDYATELEAYHQQDNDNSRGRNELGNEYFVGSDEGTYGRKFGQLDDVVGPIEASSITDDGSEAEEWDRTIIKRAHEREEEDTSKTNQLVATDNANHFHPHNHQPASEGEEDVKDDTYKKQQQHPHRHHRNKHHPNQQLSTKHHHDAHYRHNQHNYHHHYPQKRRLSAPTSVETQGVERDDDVSKVDAKHKVTYPDDYVEDFPVHALSTEEHEKSWNSRRDQLYLSSLVDSGSDKLFIGDSKSNEREFYMNEDELLMVDNAGQFATPLSTRRPPLTTTTEGMANGEGHGQQQQLLLKEAFDHWPTKHESVVEGDLILGGLMMVHEREDSVTCGPIMPQGGIQALEAMLYTLDRVNEMKLLPDISLGAHILDDCDKDTYGLEMAVDFIKGTCRRVGASKNNRNRSQVGEV